MIQTILSYAIIFISVSYAARRIYKVFKYADDRCNDCRGCMLKDLRQMRNKKKAVC